MTRDEFDRIGRRTSREIARFAQQSVIRIHEMWTERQPTRAFVRWQERALRTQCARLHAALDQYDAAKRDVPVSWLSPGEEQPEA